MGREDQIIEERRRKLEELKKLGINPYPYKFDRKNLSSEVKEDNKGLKNDEKSKNKAVVAGRVISKRDLGKLFFVVIHDSKGKLQLVLEKTETGKDFDLFKKYVS